MTPAWIWARCEIRRGWPWLLIVSLMIAIAGGAVMAGMAGARRAGASVDRFLAEVDRSDAVIYTQNPLSRTLSDRLSADSRIAGLEHIRLALAGPGSLDPGLEVATIVLPDDAWGPGPRPRLTAGRYPHGPDEIAMTETAQEISGLEVGSTVDMQMMSPSALATCVESGVCNTDAAGAVTITGTLREPDDLAAGAFGQAVFVAPAAFLDQRGGDANATGFITDLELVDRADVRDVVADYSLAVGEAGDVSTTEDGMAGSRRAAQLQSAALIVASLIGAAAGILLAGQAYGRHLGRRRNEAGTLLSIGMTRGRRAFAAWIPGALGTLAGAAVAIPVAIALSPAFPLAMARRADPDVGFHVDATLLAIGFAAVTVVGFVTAAISSWWWSRSMSPIATATDVSIASSMATRLHLSPVTTMGSRFALEPGRGDRRTPVLTSLGGVAAAVTVVVGALTLSSSLDGLLASPDRYGAPWDLIVSTGDQTESLTESILNDERVSAAAEAVVGELDVSVGSSPLQTTAIGITPVMGSMNAVVLDGHPPVGPNEVVLGTDTMRLLGVGIGETVDVSGPGGERPLTVVGRGIVPVLGNPNTGVGLVVPVDTFIALGGDRLAATIDVEHGVLLRFHDQHDAASVATELEAMGAGIDRPFRQSSVSVLDEIRAVPILIACFTAVLGGLATIDALIVTGRRRRSDLAVTRALGLRPRDAGRVLNWQGATLAAVALLIGVPLGLVAGAGVWRLVADRTNVLVVVDPPWLAIAAVGVTAIVGAGVVLAAAPAVAVRRRRPAADLRAE